MKLVVEGCDELLLIFFVDYVIEDQCVFQQVLVLVINVVEKGEMVFFGIFVSCFEIGYGYICVSVDV